MKQLLNKILLSCFLTFLLYACKKDEVAAVIAVPATITTFTSSANQVVLSSATDSTNVVTFKWTAPNYGIKVVTTYSLQFDIPADTSGTNAWGNSKTIIVADTQKTYLGTDFNSLMVAQLGLPTATASTIVVRLKSAVNQSTGNASIVPNLYATISMVVTPYKAVIIYPALLVKGGNSWHTPIPRTNGYLLTSVKYDGVYEGYLNLTNADGYGGDAFQLISTTDAKVYGYGSSSTTMSIGGSGNLWLTPAPNYMRVIADINALTINYTPVKFFISGDDNGWSTSATPMTFNSATNQWVANNVTLTSGKAFVFTSNGSYDISFKVDAKGILIFSGSPTWLGTNIPISKTGTFTVTLDLSGGAGNYTYSVK